MNFNEIISRIKQSCGVTADQEVASLLRLSRSAFAQRKKEKSIPYAAIVRLSKQKGISIDWFLTGKQVILKVGERIENNVYSPPSGFFKLYKTVLNDQEDLNDLKEDVARLKEEIRKLGEQLARQTSRLAKHIEKS